MLGKDPRRKRVLVRHLVRVTPRSLHRDADTHVRQLFRDPCPVVATEYKCLDGLGRKAELVEMDWTEGGWARSA